MTAVIEAKPRSRKPAHQAVSPPRAPWGWLPWAIGAVSLVLFLYGVRTIPEAGPFQFGLLFAASPAYGVSILLAAVAFVVAVRRDDARAAVMATVLMIVVLRVPRSVATELPMYAWTYKHLGVVDYIQHSEALARGVDIYNGWPGLFSLVAWFSDLTKISPLSIAHWFTPVFHVFFAAVVYGVARCWGLKNLQAITAMFLVVTLNWVEQDYFSPQAVGMLYAAAILMLAGLARERAAATAVIVVLFAALTVTHQLTPYWVLLALGLLVLGRALKPWWIVPLLGVLLLGWLLYNFQQAAEFTLFSSNPLENAETNIPTVGVAGQRMTSAGIRALSACLWLATAVALLLRWRRKEKFWANGAIALSPMLILGGQGYGGEAVFRIFLYSLIGCSLVLAPLVVAGLRMGAAKFAATAVGVLMATALAVQGNTGGWYANVMPKAQYDAAQQLLKTAELPAYLTPVVPAWPDRSNYRYVDYARFKRYYDGLMLDANVFAGRDFKSVQDYKLFAATLEQRGDAPTYLIITDQAQIYAWYFGLLPWDALPNLKRWLEMDTERWQPFIEEDGVTIYLHKIASQNNEPGAR